jgi:hypothetical protein
MKIGIVTRIEIGGILFKKLNLKIIHKKMILLDCKNWKI